MRISVLLQKSVLNYPPSSNSESVTGLHGVFYIYLLHPGHRITILYKVCFTDLFDIPPPDNTGGWNGKSQGSQ